MERGNGLICNECKCVLIMFFVYVDWIKIIINWGSLNYRVV